MSEEAVKPLGEEERCFGLTFRLEVFRDDGGPGAAASQVNKLTLPMYTRRFQSIPERLFERALLTFFMELTAAGHQEEVRIIFSNLAKAEDQDQLMLLDISRMHRPKHQEDSKP